MPAERRSEVSVWSVVSRVEREIKAHVVESEDIHVLLYRDKASALKAAKRKFARLYNSLARESIVRHPDRAAIERDLVGRLSAGFSYFLDVTYGDVIVVFMRKLEVK